MIKAVVDHLWQSTLFLALAGLLVLALRDNRARIRFRLWFAASVKFLVPFGALTMLGRFLPTPSLPELPARAALLAQPATEAFAPPPAMPPMPAAATAPSFDWPLLLMLALWGIGVLVMTARWVIRWARLRAMVRRATSLTHAAGVPVMTAPSLMEPGLVGIFKPVILLPAGITDRVSQAELDSILAHELCHRRGHDNLLAAIHMLVEAVFWFFPPVWWLGARLNDERERACDEMVLASGTAVSVYVESILKVCRHYLESPLPCVAGISGADLKSRLDRIVTNRQALRLNSAKKILLAGAAALALAIPLLATAQPTDSLDGWGPFKFGMTPEQVRALPAPAGPWRVSPYAQGFANLYSPGVMQVFGAKFTTPSFGFGGDSRLNNIMFSDMHTNQENVSAEECEQSFNRLMTALEAQYGAFGPGYRAVKGATVRPVGMKSHYQYAVDPDDSPDSYWPDARLVRSGHYLDIRHSHRSLRGRQYCMTGITFSAKSPQAPNAPVYQRS